MLSAVKNFALTFIISLLVFSFAAYSIVGLILTNLSGITGNDTSSLSTSSPLPELTNPNGEIINNPSSDIGSSFNVLMITTDYHPELYMDYDPKILDKMFGIERQPIIPQPVPDDLAEPKNIITAPDHDPEDENIVVGADGMVAIPDGFYQVGYRKVRSTSIILVRFDKEFSQVTFTYFPTNSIVSIGGRYIEFGDVYIEFGLSALCDKVHAITGCTIDRHIVVHPRDIQSIVDKLGGVSFKLPCTMTFIDGTEGQSLTLNEGEQMLNGKNVCNVLEFDSYATDGQSRELTALEFSRAVIANITQPSNYPNSVQLLSSLSELCMNDFTESDFRQKSQLIFYYPQLDNRNISIALKKQILGGEQRIVVDELLTKTMFSTYHY